MARTVDIGKLSDAVMDILDDYEASIEDKMTESLESVAQEGVRKLKSTSPGGGEYAKSWTKKIEGKQTLKPRAILYNKKYPLAHLLENGHVKVLWGKRTNEFVPAKVHIAPVNDWVQEKFESDISVVIKGG